VGCPGCATFPSVGKQLSLSRARRRTLAAAAERILPADDGPGAAAAGVAAYVESALHEEALQPVRPLLEHGLDLLDALAREHHAAGFAACGPAAQDDVLRRLEGLEGRAETWPRAFLRRLVLLSLEGFLCDPARGGNRDGLGWQSVGFDPAEPASGPAPGQG
jgi:gluconate 2-dehydrogenase gamma chain